MLGLYAMARRPGPAWSWAHSLRRGLAYALGVGVGVIPLALYNQLTFGSITHVAYHDIQHNQTGFFGIRAPDLSGAYALLFDSRGLLTLSPVLVMAFFGLVAMYRRGPPRRGRRHRRHLRRIWSTTRATSCPSAAASRARAS